MPPTRPPTARFKITGPVELAQGFLRKRPIEPQSVRIRDTRVEFFALLTAEEQRLATGGGLEVEMIEEPQSRNRRRDVGVGDRFASGGVPRKAGIDPPAARGELYYNNDEAASALRNLAATYPSLTEVFSLPHASALGTSLQGLHLRKDDGIARPAFVFTGCIHGNEWGSCEILLKFASGLLDAYTNQSSLVFGNPGVQFSGAQVQSILDDFEIVIVPVLNPDGRATSQASITNASLDLGRTNANGVDLNRNFDVMFKWLNYVSPDAGYSVTSVPGTSLYQGSSAESESETKNVTWLFDGFPHARWFVDLHSAGRSINYGWSCDHMQSVDSNMTFTNPNYDGTWGDYKDNVAEHFDQPLIDQMKSMADRFAVDASNVRQTNFRSVPIFTFAVFPGTSDSHAHSLHKLDNAREPVLGFCVEWGDVDFQPAPDEMEQVVDEVAAGLVGFCLAAN